MNALIHAAERGEVPDGLIRFGIRRMLKKRLVEQRKQSRAVDTLDTITRRMREAPIAIDTDRANDQHYELPAEFFKLMLGPRLKYSSCWWDDEAQDLVGAEEKMLSLTARRAQIEDGMRVLDLGCGWGSLSLWVAENFPRCQVTAVSNSVWQQRFIRRRAEAAGLTNVQCVQADMNEFDPERRFDRVVSIEMFEHMRNYEQLLARIAGWLESDGRLFVHTFCHQRFAYFFEVEGDDDWMARYFFTGGMMPSFDLISRFDRDLRLATQWFVDGQHYQKTLLAWLDRLDRQRQQTVETLAKCYGPGQAELWLQRWRMFLLACAELFGYKKGGEWFVGHYLLEPTPRP